MATNAQVAYQAAAVGGEQEREADLEPRVTVYFNWLQAQPSGTPVVVGNAQAALLAAVSAYSNREGSVPEGEVTDLATSLLADITAHAAGNTS